MRDTADVRAFGAGEFEFAERLGVIRETEVVDVNESRLAFYLNAFAREFVKRDTVFFDGGNHRGNLHLIADKCGSVLVQLIKSHRRHRQRAGEFAVGIVALSGFAELHRTFVHFVVAHQTFGEFCAATEDYDEQASRVGIERATMADFLDAEPAADGIHDIVRSRAGRFINQDCAIKRGKILHR